MTATTRTRKLLFGLLVWGMVGSVLFGLTESFLRLRERRLLQALTDADPLGVVVPSDVPGLNYTLRPGARIGEIAFNSLGLSMPERPVAKASNRIRLAFVGDSVTQGVGTSRTAEAFPNQVDRILRESSRFEAWNCGVAGYNADQVRLYIREVLPELHPDAVIYAFNFNDHRKPLQYDRGQVVSSARKTSGLRAGFLETVKRLRTAILLANAYSNLLYRARGYPPSHVDRKVSSPAWRHMKDSIAGMRENVAAAGLPFAIVVFPTLPFLFQSAEQNLAHRDLLEWLDRSGILYLDLLPELRAHRMEDIYLPDGNHLNTRGYRLAAESIAAWIRANSDRLTARTAAAATP